MIRTIIALTAYLTILYFSRVEYACYPFTPKEECQESVYHFTIRSIRQPGKPVIGSGAGKCVAQSGNRLFIYDAKFQGMEMEKLELPAMQTQVCELR